MIGKQELLKKLVELWGNVRNQKYTVYRGAINWPNHDFTNIPYAVSVMMDECSFLKEINEGILSFEIFAPIVEEKQINDEELDIQLSNVMEVFYELGKTKNSKGNSYGAILPGTERCIEHYDSSYNVQGLIILVSVKF